MKVRIEYDPTAERIEIVCANCDVELKVLTGGQVDLEELAVHEEECRAIKEEWPAVDPRITAAVSEDDRLVTVCAHCKQASCWRAFFHCDRYQTAGTVQMRVGELRALALEHPDYWRASEDYPEP